MVRGDDAVAVDLQARQRLRHGAGRQQDVAALDALAVHVDRGRRRRACPHPRCRSPCGRRRGPAGPCRGPRSRRPCTCGRPPCRCPRRWPSRRTGRPRGPGRRSRRRAAAPSWGCSRCAGRCRRACPSRSGRRPGPAAPRAAPRRNRRYRRRGSLGRKRCWRRSPRHVLHACAPYAGPLFPGDDRSVGWCSAALASALWWGPCPAENPSSHLSAAGGTPGRAVRRLTRPSGRYSCVRTYGFRRGAESRTRATDACSPASADPARRSGSAVSPGRPRRCARRAAPGCGRRSRCRPWGCSRRAPSWKAGPAMSRCAQVMPSPTNSFRKRPATRPPPMRSPMLAMSAVGESMPLRRCVGQRHRPGRLADLLGDLVHRGAEGVVVGHDAEGAVAQRQHHRAGQRRHVDDRVRRLLGGPGERVGQDQTALGVGVQHLDGLAAVHPQHVAGAGRGAGRHVLGERQPAGDVDLEAQPGGGDDGGEDGGGAGSCRTSSSRCDRRASARCRPSRR